jgi:hypothetical protein
LLPLQIKLKIASLDFASRYTWYQRSVGESNYLNFSAAEDSLLAINLDACVYEAPPISLPREFSHSRTGAKLQSLLQYKLT